MYRAFGLNSGQLPKSSVAICVGSDRLVSLCSVALGLARFYCCVAASVRGVAEIVGGDEGGSDSKPPLGTVSALL